MTGGRFKFNGCLFKSKTADNAADKANFLKS